MKLQNLLSHKKNTAVLVNGTIYKIAHDHIIRDEQGNVLDVCEKDAKKLLANKLVWRELEDAETKEVKKDKIGMQKIVSRETKQVTNDEKTKPEIEVSQVMAAQEGELESKPTVNEPITTPVKTQNGDPPIPKGEEEWADPSDKYSMNWLQKCAKAYGIVYTGKNKLMLVQKIKKAMY